MSVVGVVEASLAIPEVSSELFLADRRGRRTLLAVREVRADRFLLHVVLRLYFVQTQDAVASLGHVLAIG